MTHVPSPSDQGWARIEKGSPDFPSLYAFSASPPSNVNEIENYHLEARTTAEEKYGVTVKPV